jgi:hypothetical protein
MTRGSSTEVATHIRQVTYFAGQLPQEVRTREKERQFDRDRADQQASDMSRRFRAVPVVPAVAMLVLLAGCGASGPRGAEPAVATLTPLATGTPTPSARTTAPEPSTTNAASPVSCPTIGAAAVRDGTWSGPVTMDVRGRGAGSSYATAQGTGSMRITVASGRVTAGRWSLRWHSRGHVRVSGAAAGINLSGTLGGTATGPATRPVLTGTWAIHGFATITQPEHATVPIEETGRASEHLTITASSCGRITGIVHPSFTSKDARATFSGDARWIGSPD